ncbi:hypothetical protein AB0I28_32280 [Phytomonospora sp. NPDC050363]|uniref:hypothetical protein n=1 Tax=Phytomonospora sp. NPDC050363 TaxID=3155642 RepID=UPI0033E17916
MSVDSLVPETASPKSRTGAQLFAALLTVVLLAGVAFAFALNPPPAPGVIVAPLKPDFTPDMVVLAEDFFPDEVAIHTLGQGTDLTLELDADHDHDDCSDIGGATVEKLTEGCRYWMEVAYVHDDWLVTAYMFAYDEPSQAKEAADLLYSGDVDWLDINISPSTLQPGWHWWDTSNVSGFSLLMGAGPAETVDSQSELPEEAQDVLGAFRTWIVGELVSRT